MTWLECRVHTAQVHPSNPIRGTGRFVHCRSGAAEAGGATNSLLCHADLVWALVAILPYPTGDRGAAEAGGATISLLCHADVIMAFGPYSLSSRSPQSCRSWRRSAHPRRRAARRCGRSCAAWRHRCELNRRPWCGPVTCMQKFVELLTPLSVNVGAHRAPWHPKAWLTTSWVRLQAVHWTAALLHSVGAGCRGVQARGGQAGAAGHH